MSKVTYEVLPGVDHVNGAAVPASRKVQLTEAEAMFDLQMGRIVLKKPTARGGATQSKSKSAPFEESKSTSEVDGLDDAAHG